MTTQSPARPPMDVSRITPAAGSPRDLLRSEAVKKRFEEVLGARANQFVASLATLVYTSPGLRDCDTNSIIAAAMEAAALDLPIERNLGFAWIIPYKQDGKKVAQFQMGYKGYVQLALRTGQYAALEVNEVYPGELTFNRFTGKPAFGARSGDTVIGYLAYLRLVNGFEHFLYWTVEQLLAHGQKYSKTFARSDSKWKTDFDAMARKTLVKAILTKWGILSVDMQKAVALEAHAEEEPGAPLELSEEQMAADRAALFGEDDQPPTGSAPDNAALDREIMEKERAARAV